MWATLFSVFEVIPRYLQCPLRHKGMGSLPSAIMTSCCARTAEPLGVLFFGMAQYIPAKARTVSNTSSALFIGGVSCAQKARAWRSICPNERRGNLWIKFISARAFSFPRLLERTVQIATRAGRAVYNSLSIFHSQVPLVVAGSDSRSRDGSHLLSAPIRAGISLFPLSLGSTSAGLPHCMGRPSL